jgi:hypothetical protein
MGSMIDLFTSLIGKTTNTTLSIRLGTGLVLLSETTCAGVEARVIQWTIYE